MGVADFGDDVGGLEAEFFGDALGHGGADSAADVLDGGEHFDRAIFGDADVALGVAVVASEPGGLCDSDAALNGGLVRGGRFAGGPADFLGADFSFFAAGI